MDDLDRYNSFAKKQERAWEALCTMCGACCGSLEDPCENLAKTPNGRFWCRVYARRFGLWRTISGKELACVSIREKIKKGHSWPGDQHCGYKIKPRLST